MKDVEAIVQLQDLESEHNLWDKIWLLIVGILWQRYLVLFKTISYSDEQLETFSEFPTIQSNV